MASPAPPGGWRACVTGASSCPGMNLSPQAAGPPSSRPADMNHQAGHPPSLVPRGEGGVLANGASDVATTPAAARARPRGGITVRRVLAGGLIPAATAALVVTGLRVPTP